jgi:hypothetical protein
LQGTRGGFGIYSLGVRKDFNEKRGSIGIGAENFFTPAFKIRGESTSPTFQQKNLNVMHNMGFRVNISYRLGKMSVDGPSRPRRTRSIDNDDLKDGGDNGGAGAGMEGGGQQGPQRGGGGFGTAGNGGAMRNGGGRTANLPAGDTTAIVKVEGNWQYTIESPQGGEGTLSLSRSDDSYSGTITNKRFNSTSQLNKVSVKGNELSFEYEVTGPGGNTMPVSVKAIVDKEVFTGNMTVGQFGTFPIKAKREE